ncbi:MAG: hypothetical protein AAF490_09380 [Chloroflexota bacterium]
MFDLKNESNKKIVLGCGGGIILCFFIFAAGGLYLFNYERDSAIYPGAVVITQNSNYRSLPSNYIWNDSYRTQDDYNIVFNWYSQRFDMGPESRAIGSCAGMDKIDTFFWLRRDVSVFICQTAQGQLIFLDRVVYLR